MRPVEIIGGGLAGLTLGVALRRHDVPVTVHEAGDYPRHRVCGEFITGLDDRTIAALGLAPVLRDALRHRDVAWFAGDTPLRAQRLPSPALGISRHVLDERLARTFTELGGTLYTRSRVNVSGNPPGCVLASGRIRHNASPWIALKVHARGITLTRDLEMHLGRHAYVGLTRVADEVVNVCGLFRRGSPMAAAGLDRTICGGKPQPRSDLLVASLRAAGLGTLAERLASAPLEAASFCAVAGLQFAPRLRASDDVLRLGDAAGMIPPFTGNGMAMAFQAAASALPPVLAYARGETTGVTPAAQPTTRSVVDSTCVSPPPACSTRSCSGRAGNAA